MDKEWHTEAQYYQSEKFYGCSADSACQDSLAQSPLLHGTVARRLLASKMAALVPPRIFDTRLKLQYTLSVVFSGKITNV